MRVLVWATIIGNLVAHGWTASVLLGGGKVLRGVAFFDETDILVVFWLDAIAAVITFILACYMAATIKKTA